MTAMRLLMTSILLMLGVTLGACSQFVHLHEQSITMDERSDAVVAVARGRTFRNVVFPHIALPHGQTLKFTGQ